MNEQCSLVTRIQCCNIKNVNKSRTNTQASTATVETKLSKHNKPTHQQLRTNTNTAI